MEINQLYDIAENENIKIITEEFGQDNGFYEVSEEISIPIEFLNKVLEYRKENQNG